MVSLSRKVISSIRSDTGKVEVRMEDLRRRSRLRPIGKIENREDAPVALREGVKDQDVGCSSYVLDSHLRSLPRQSRKRSSVLHVHDQ